MPLASTGEILPALEQPSFCSVYMLDAVIAKVQVSLDELFTKSMVSTLMLHWLPNNKQLKY